MGYDQQRVGTRYFSGNLDRLMKFSVDRNFVLGVAGKTVRHNKRCTDLINTKTMAMGMHKMLYRVFPFTFI